jgi:hypothetical protein
MAGAYGRLNAAMQSAALAEIDAQIREHQRNIDKLNGLLANGGTAWTKFKTAAATGFLQDAGVMSTPEQDLGDIGDKLNAQLEQLRALKKRRSAILGGDKDSVTGETGGSERPLGGARGYFDNMAAGADKLNAAQKKVIDNQKQLADLEEQAAQRNLSRSEREILDIQKNAAERKKILRSLLQEKEARDSFQVRWDLLAKIDEVDAQVAAAVGKIQQESSSETAASQRALLDELQRQSLQEQVNNAVTPEAKRQAEQNLRSFEADSFVRDKSAGAMAAFAGNPLGLAQAMQEISSIAALMRSQPGDQLAVGPAQSTSRGIFNVSAIQSLAGATNEAKRTAKATEDTAKNTRRLIGLWKPSTFGA